MSSQIPITSVRIPLDLKRWFRDYSAVNERTMTREMLIAMRKYAAEHEGTEEEALAFAVSKNLARRHLCESQRAMIGARLANMEHGGDRRSDQAANLPVVSQPEAAARVTAILTCRP